jgi:protein phosphatase
MNSEENVKTANREPRTANCQIQIPDPSLILLIGPSGAGKSTFAARHFQPTEIVSSDRCRAMICDDESDQTLNSEVFRLVHYLVRVRLVLKRLTVVDATNLQYEARRPFLRMARVNRMPVVAVVFDVSPETCLSNNRARPNRFVNEDVLKQHFEELTEAINSIKGIDREGYEQIHFLDAAKLDEATIERVKIDAESRFQIEKLE